MRGKVSHWKRTIKINIKCGETFAERGENFFHYRETITPAKAARTVGGLGLGDWERVNAKKQTSTAF